MIKNLKLKKALCGVLAPIVMTSGIGGVEASAASKKSVLETYNSKKAYGMQNESEIMIPMNVKVDRNGNQQYNYATVVLEFSADTINPAELTNIIYGANKINKESGRDKFAYIDANEEENERFKINGARKNSDATTLVNYINAIDKNASEKRETINHNKYAEFWLPVLGRYSYKDSQGNKQIYERTEYIYFYIPYTKLNNKTDLSKYAEYAYARYQDGSFDHNITWKEIKAASKTKDAGFSKQK